MEQKLVALGAVLDGVLSERDEYWAHPARDFGATDEALRLRVITAEDGGGWGRAELTYKGPKVDADTKTRFEETVEVKIDELGALRRILESLGFRPFGAVTKVRREFAFEGLTVCLDRVEGLGTFVEIESVTDELVGTKKRIFDLFGRLGLTAFERRSYLELVLARQKTHKGP